MDIMHIFNESAQQMTDLYGIPKEAALIAIPVIIIGGTLAMFFAGDIADAIVAGSTKY